MATLRNVPAGNLQKYFSDLVTTTIERWEKYKDDFFIRNDPEGILKASFAVCYLLFVLEYTNEPLTRILTDHKRGSPGVIVPAINQIPPTQAAQLPGFDYLIGNTFTGMVILKEDLLSRTYKQLEDGMLEAIRNKTQTLQATLARNGVAELKNAFKYTGYSKKSVFTNVFFYHSLVMFGWYMCYGFHKDSQGRDVVKDFPGSCNVQGCINMYLFKKAGVLDQIVYVPHGKNQVSRSGEISTMSAQRTQGIDDVQFCHHGFRLVNVPHDIESGYFANHYVKVIRSHIDAFDVLTLTPIFRCIQRLRRTGKADRVRYINDFLDVINTDIKTFVREHRMSNLPGGPMFMSQRKPDSNRLQSANKVQKNSRSNNTVKNWVTFRKFINFMNNLNNNKRNFAELRRKYGEYYNLFIPASKQARSLRGMTVPNISNNARRLGKKYQNNYLKL